MKVNWNEREWDSGPSIEQGQDPGNGDSVPPGHIGVGECCARLNAFHSTGFNGNMLQELLWTAYRCCCGPHSVGIGPTCIDCVNNAVTNSLLFGPRCGPQLPGPSVEEDSLYRWFEIREITPESGRGVTPFEDSTGLRTTGGPGGFGNV